MAPSMQPRVSVGWTVATLSEISPPVRGALRGAPVGPLDAWPLMRVQLSGTAEEEGGAPLPDAARVTGPLTLQLGVAECLGGSPALRLAL